MGGHSKTLGRSSNSLHRSIQIDYRQTRFCWGELLSNYRYRIVLPEELISITETDLWGCLQKISLYRYRFSLEFQFKSGVEELTQSIFRSLEKGKFVFQSSSPKLYLNWTGSVFALPKLISITDTDFGRKTNGFCEHSGYKCQQYNHYPIVIHYTEATRIITASTFISCNELTKNAITITAPKFFEIIECNCSCLSSIS